MATAGFITDAAAFREFRGQMAERLGVRLRALHAGLTRLRERGLAIESVEPQGTLYLSARFPVGVTVAGRRLESNDDVRRLLLEEAGFAVVPFQAFGVEGEDGWCRLSVGAASVAGIEAGLARLERVFTGVPAAS
jgi:aspartate aminotransferase